MKLFVLLGVGLTSVGLLAGCGKSAASLSSRNAALFESAPPEIKSDWEKATAAAKTNGYVVAITTFQKLQRAALSPEQLQAVNETVSAVSDQMYETANRGDAAATQAIAELRTQRRR